MKKKYLFKFIGLLVVGLFSANAQPITQTFSYTGAVQKYVVPACVSEITITAKGAQGGANSTGSVSGGLGGMAVGTLSVTVGDTLYLYVGGMGGFNGGGAPGAQPCTQAIGGWGGGATDVRVGGIAYADRVIAAGGGGGAGGNRVAGCGRGAGGGGGGGYYGGGGGAGWPQTGTNATGGTQTGGGNGGTSGWSSNNNGFAGSLGQGGAGGNEVSGNQAGSQTSFVGGAGGGLAGGNGNHSLQSADYSGASGGGGSSYLGSLTGASTSSNVNTGNGSIELIFNTAGGYVTASAPSTAICAGSSINITALGNVVTYTWNIGSNNSSINVAPTGNTVYVVMATNSVNCTSVSSITMAVNPTLPVLSITCSTPQTCFGKSVTLNASGANTYTWSNNINNGVAFSPSVTTAYTVSGQNACGITSGAITVTVSPISVTLSANPATVCSGYVATLTASAAATSYTWLPGNASGSTFYTSPQSATVYSLSVSDGTCQGSGTVMVSTLPLPTVSIVSSNTLICSGDPLYLSASGGQSYTWTPGNLSGPSQTVIPGGSTSYSVTASNSIGCVSGAYTIVVVNAIPIISVVSSNVLICKGASVTFTASGASSYTWSSGGTSSVTILAPQSSTVISITGESNGCVATQTAAVDLYIPLTSISGPTVICSGTTVTLTATPANSYSWSTGSQFQTISESPTTTTLYTVGVTSTSNNVTCPASASLQVVVNPNPTVTAVASRTSICVKEKASITASGAVSYNWLGGGIVSGATSPSVVISNSLVTTVMYTVIGTAATGCTNQATEIIAINACNSLKENQAENDYLSIYPNPSAGEITVKAKGALNISIINELGEVVKTLQLNEGNNYMTLVKDLANGIYFITGDSGEAKVSRKIIVNR